MILESDTPIRHISRDPFARTSLVRRIVWVHSPSRTCSWCDGQRITPAGNRYLFSYGTEYDDNNHLNWHEGRFCADDCFYSYHDLQDPNEGDAA